MYRDDLLGGAECRPPRRSRSRRPSIEAYIYPWTQPTKGGTQTERFGVVVVRSLGPCRRAGYADDGLPVRSAVAVCSSNNAGTNRDGIGHPGGS